MNTHDFKTWPAEFSALWSGAKTAELRNLSDRDVKVGDTAFFYEFDPDDNKQYTGRRIVAKITHLQKGFGLEPGNAMLSLQVVRQQMISSYFEAGPLNCTDFGTVQAILNGWSAHGQKV